MTLLSDGPLYLTPMEEQFIPLKVKWINDPDVRHSLNFDYPLSVAGTKQWLYKICRDETRKDFVICLKADHTPIGYAGLLNIDFRNSKVETYLGIGEPGYWGKGYGTTTKRLLVEFAFYELGLRRVYSYNWPENIGMTSINRRLGFKVEGKLRQDVLSHGEYRDRILMALLRDDYNQGRKR